MNRQIFLTIFLLVMFACSVVLIITQRKELVRTEKQINNLQMELVDSYSRIENLELKTQEIIDLEITRKLTSDTEYKISVKDITRVDLKTFLTNLIEQEGIIK